MYKISVITICFNNLEELQATCASVDKQLLPPHEHIIVDGSTNKAISNYLATYTQPVYRKWKTEPDAGIADAFNKGVQRATGDIINMLNSADQYYDEHVLQTVSKAFDNDPALAWLHGKYQLQRGNIWVTIGKPFNAGKLYRGMRSISHQSMFVKKALHDKYGLYDTSYKNAMDYDFLCRISREKFLFINRPLIVFAPGGATDTNYLRSLHETKRSYVTHFGNPVLLNIWQMRLKLLFHLLKSPLGKLLYKIKVALKLENM